MAVSGGDGVEGLVLAERLDDGAAEQILAAVGLADERFLNRRISPVCGQGPDERRADELRHLLVEFGEQPRSHRRLRVGFEPGIGDVAKAIVAIVDHRQHDGSRAWIVEPREQHERAEADVAVGMAGHRLGQSRYGLRRRGTPDEARSLDTCRVIELAQLIDRGRERQASRGHSRRRRGLRSCWSAGHRGLLRRLLRGLRSPCRHHTQQRQQDCAYTEAARDHLAMRSCRQG